MNDDEYVEALRTEQSRRQHEIRDENLIHEANLNRISQEHNSGGGHGGAIAGVIIMLVVGIAAWMYLG